MNLPTPIVAQKCGFGFLISILNLDFGFQIFCFGFLMLDFLNLDFEFLYFCFCFYHPKLSTILVLLHRIHKCNFNAEQIHSIDKRAIGGAWELSPLVSRKH